MNTERENLLELQELCKTFGRKGKQKKAVDRVSFAVRKGEVFGLVGESGCGKTTLGRCIAGFYEPTGGSIRFKGEPLSGKKAVRGIQMIFQDQTAALDPRMTAGQSIAEGLRIGGLKDRGEIERQVGDMLTKVGLSPEHAGRYPHELSGGQRQRAGIARALILRPELIIADEPVSALDASLRGQIIDLLNKLKQEMDLTILFIAHDLSLVRSFCDRIAVMYAGRIVELAPAEELFAHPLHPYTEALLSAVPIPDPLAERERKQREQGLKTEFFLPENASLQEVSSAHFLLRNAKEESLSFT